MGNAADTVVHRHRLFPLRMTQSVQSSFDPRSQTRCDYVEIKSPGFDWLSIRLRIWGSGVRISPGAPGRVLGREGLSSARGLRELIGREPRLTANLTGDGPPPSAWPTSQAALPDRGGATSSPSSLLLRLLLRRPGLGLALPSLLLLHLAHDVVEKGRVHHGPRLRIFLDPRAQGGLETILVLLPEIGKLESELPDQLLPPLLVPRRCGSGVLAMSRRGMTRG